MATGIFFTHIFFYSYFAEAALLDCGNHSLILSLIG